MIGSYRTAQDALDSALLPWLASRGDITLEKGVGSWVVVPHLSHAIWLRKSAIDKGINLLGVEFMTPGDLRRRLATCFAVNYQPTGRDGLGFLLRMASFGVDHPLARSVYGDPSAMLNALDALGRSGHAVDGVARWLDGDLGPYLAALSETPGWIPFIDSEILDAANKAGRGSIAADVVFYGWDGAQFPNHRLLRAVHASALTCSVLYPQPLAMGEDADLAWGEALETWLAEESVDICSGYTSPNQGLSDALMSQVDTLQGEKPDVLIGKDWMDQSRLIAQRVLELLSAGGGRIGVILPARSVVCDSLAVILRGAGVPVLVEAGVASMEPPEIAAQRLLAEVMAKNGDVEVFLNLLDALWKLRGELSVKIDPVGARRAFHQAFGVLQTRDFRLLCSEIGSRFGGNDKVLELGQLLQSWPSMLAWEDAKSRWEACLSALGLDTVILEPIWSRLDAVLNGRQVPTITFFRYVQDLLESRPQRRDPANAPYAPVVLTTLERAAQQSWGHLVFAECNDGVWPVNLEDAPLLDTERIKEVNEQRAPGDGFLLSPVHKSNLSRRMVFNLIESCDGRIVFSAQTAGIGALGKPAAPNEWLSQVLTLTGSGRFESAGVATRAAAGVCDLRHFSSVHLSRKNPEMPFDEYFFNFGKQDEMLWPASKLSAAVNQPATFALQVLFGASSQASISFSRSERWSVGLLSHSLLEASARAIRDRRVDVATAPEKIIEQVCAEVIDKFSMSEHGADSWKGSIFRKSQYYATRCLALALPLIQSHRGCSPEVPIKGEVQTNSGVLRISGRLDLAMGDFEGTGGAAEILDFKTGSVDAFSPASFSRGNNLQFLAYLGVLLGRGASRAGVWMVSPFGGKPQGVTSDDAEWVKEFLAPLAELQQSMCFGMGPVLRSEYGSGEELPMATLPVAPEILEAKAERSEFNG